MPRPGRTSLNAGKTSTSSIGIAFALTLSKKGTTPPVSAFRTGRDALSSARGFFFTQAPQRRPQASNLQGNAEKRLFFGHFPVNNL
jgi:hypothetical protein